MGEKDLITVVERKGRRDLMFHDTEILSIYFCSNTHHNPQWITVSAGETSVSHVFTIAQILWHQVSLLRKHVSKKEGKANE